MCAICVGCTVLVLPCPCRVLFVARCLPGSACRVGVFVTVIQICVARYWCRNSPLLKNLQWRPYRIWRTCEWDLGRTLPVVSDPTSPVVPSPTSRLVPGSTSPVVPGTTSPVVPGPTSPAVPGPTSSVVPDHTSLVRTDPPWTRLDGSSCDGRLDMAGQMSLSCGRTISVCARPTLLECYCICLTTVELQCKLLTVKY